MAQLDWPIAMTHRNWNSRADNRAARLARAAQALGGRLRGKLRRAPTPSVPLLEAVIEPGDRVCLEGNNQKQADFLAQALVASRPAARARPAHGAVGAGAAGAPRPVRDAASRAARLLLFRAAGRAARASWLARAASRSARSTPTSNCSRRYFVDLTPQVALVAAQAADAHGNLYTGPNTEDTPAIVEATAFSRRHRHRAGQRDWSTSAAARRHPGRLGRLRRAGARAATSSSRCSRATRRRSARSRC